MRILIAPDKFKGSLTAAAAASAIAAGAARALPVATFDLCPLADGGDGTAGCLLEVLGGTEVDVPVTGPLGEARQARLVILADGTAVVEMARASGLALLDRGSYQPLHATTRGTGELLQAAAARGPRRILVGLGGSATVDGGAGMAQALGIRLLDAGGHDLPPGGGALERLARIDASGLDSVWHELEVVALCDVANPLLGPDGAATVYGPQKGATPPMVARLERGLTRLAELLDAQLGVAVASLPGAGAAGGLGAGLAGFLGAALLPGAGVVLEQVGFAGRLEGASLLITGEGAYDSQTGFGKAPGEAVRRAADAGVPALILAGSVRAAAPPGAVALSIVPGPATLGEAMLNARAWLEEAAYSATALLDLRLKVP